MKKYIQVFVLLVMLSCLISISCQEKAIIPEKEIDGALLMQVDHFSKACNRLKTLADSANPEPASMQQAFLKCRLAYKKFEWAAGAGNGSIRR